MFSTAVNLSLQSMGGLENQNKYHFEQQDEVTLNSGQVIKTSLPFFFFCGHHQQSRSELET